MNKLETQYAERLELLKRAGEILWWRYEPAKFRLTDRDKLTSLTPDFLVQMADGEIQVRETKGFLDVGGDGWLKCKLLADQYPFRVFLCQYKNKATGWVEKEV